MSKLKNKEVTSPRVATIASKLLSNPKTPANVKTIAAAVLTQTPNRPSKPKGK